MGNSACTGAVWKFGLLGTHNCDLFANIISACPTKTTMQMLWHWRCTAGTTCFYPGDFYKSEREKLLKFVNLCCGLTPQPCAVANHQPRSARFSLAVSRSGTCDRGALRRKRTLALGLAGRRKTKQKVRSALRRVNRVRNSRLGSSARRQTKAACSVSSWRSSKNYINCLPFHSLPVTEKFLRALNLVSELKRCYFLRFTRCKIILPTANLKSKFATVAGLEKQPNGIYRCDGL